MLDEIILHIGTPKTGTTALQLALSRQRRDLFRFGLFFPETSLLGERAQPVNLQDLTLFAANPDRPLALSLFRRQATKDPAAYKKRIRNAVAALAKETTAQGCSRLLLSAEGLYNRLKTHEEIERLHALLEPHTRAFRILVWFRRQDEYLLSRISQAAKLGTVTIDAACRIDDLYQYASRMQAWENVFSSAAFHAIPYRRDTLADFQRVMNLPGGLLRQTGKETNRSLSAEAIALLAYQESQRNNPALATEEGLKKTARLRRIIRQIDKTRQGSRLQLSRPARQKLMASCASENEVLAKRYNNGVPFFDLSDLDPGKGFKALPVYEPGESLMSELNLPEINEASLFEWLTEMAGQFPQPTRP